MSGSKIDRTKAYDDVRTVVGRYCEGWTNVTDEIDEAIDALIDAIEYARDNYDGAE